MLHKKDATCNYASNNSQRQPDFVIEMPLVAIQAPPLVVAVQGMNGTVGGLQQEMGQGSRVQVCPAEQPAWHWIPILMHARHAPYL